MIRNIRPLLRDVYNDLRDFVQAQVSPVEMALNDQERGVVERLRRDGFALVEDYMSREKVAQWKTKLLGLMGEGAPRDLAEGAYVRRFDRKPGDDGDDGVTRLYHADKVFAELKSLRYDPFVFRVAHAYYNFPMHSAVLTFQSNPANTKTRYYHIDGFQPEFKSFLYLDDVEEGNGPFTYIKGSHREHFVRLRKQLLGNGERSPTSFYDEDLGGILKNEVKVTAKAGTLLLADVRGIHRGSPQSQGDRRVLVNYLYRNQHEFVPDDKGKY